MNFPKSNLPPMPTITSISLGSAGDMVATMNAGGALTDLNLTTGSRYYPFVLNRPITVDKLFIANGATVLGNIDLGIYDASGTRIVSTGSTAMSGASSIQVINVADTTIGPGMYYLAFGNSATAAFQRVTGSAVGIDTTLAGLASEATFPLPASATFITTLNSSVALMGLSIVSNI